MLKSIKLRLDEALIDALRIQARAEQRSMANYIVWALGQVAAGQLKNSPAPAPVALAAPPAPPPAPTVSVEDFEAILGELEAKPVTGVTGEQWGE